MKERISPKEWILLSSYLDDELRPREKARVEARIQAEPELSEALESLRRTKGVLGRAPTHRAPRNFTLPVSQAQTRPSQALRLVPALQVFSAATALAAVFFIVSTWMGGLSRSMPMVSAPADQVTQEAVTLSGEAEPALEVQSSPPPVIYWGGPPTSYEVYGLGSGADGAAGEMGGSVGGYVPQLMVAPTRPVEMFKSQPTGVPGLASVTPAPEVELPAQPPRGSGPILGIAPAEQQGEVLPETFEQMMPMIAAEHSLQEEQAPGVSLYDAVGIGLLVLAVGLFVTAMIIRRNALH